MTKLLIRGGTVVNADREFRADVLCDGGTIAAVGATSTCPPAHETLDAGGRYVMPGGIDPHTHMQLPFMGDRAPDDFFTGTAAGLSRRHDQHHRLRDPRPAAAAAGCLPHVARLGREVGQRPRLPRRRDVVERQACTHDMGTLVREEGVNSFKHFMAYKNAIMCDDETLVNSFKRALELGAMPTVHAENGELVFLLQQEVLKSGITGPEGHPLSRPPMVEGEAANRAIAIAGVLGVPIYIVHVSCIESAEAIARRAGERPAGVRRGARRPPRRSTTASTAIPTSRTAAAYVMSPPFRPEGAPGVPVARPAVRPAAHHGHRSLRLLRAAEGAAAATTSPRSPNGSGGIEDRMRVHLGRRRQHRSPDAERVRRDHVGQLRASSSTSIRRRAASSQAPTPTSCSGTHRRRRRSRLKSRSSRRATSTSSKAATCAATPTHTLSQGKLVWADGDLRAAIGAGRHIKRPAVRPELRCDRQTGEGPDGDTGRA